MKNNKIWTILSVIVLVLQIAAEVLAAVAVFQLNMLPNRYTLILAAALAVMLLATALLLFVPGKKGVGIVRRIIAFVLAIIIISGCGVLTKIAADAYSAMDAVTQGEEPTNTKGVYVFVRADDPASTIADAANYTFAIVQDFEEEQTQKAIDEIQKQTGNAITVTQYEMLPQLADALYAKEADALILSDAGVALLLEQESYGDFMDKSRVLMTIEVDKLQITEIVETTPEAVTPVEDITNTPFVVYISGLDTRNKMLSVSRSDVNILAVVNPNTKQVLLLNTPRDYYVPNPAGDGKLDKLTHCGIYGIDCSMQALEGLYGTEIQHYARINFTGFETLIDAVGGITVYSDQGFTTNGTTIVKGENYLYGFDALNFARERYRVNGGDNGRGKNQMKVITALIGKMTSGRTIISNYSAILKSLEGMFTTSFTTDEISACVKMQLNDMARWNVQSYAVVGTGGSEKTYSAPGMRAYVMHPNEKSVAYATELINRVLAGETLTAEDMKLPG